MIRIIVSIWTFLIGMFRARGTAPTLELGSTPEPVEPDKLIAFEVPAHMPHEDMQHAAVMTAFQTGQPVLVTRAEPTPIAQVNGTPEDRLRRAGELAVAEAVRLWSSDIYDPSRSDKSERANRCRAAIDSMLRACGWSWEIPYLGNGQVEWCGIFAGTCWRAAGIDIQWLATYFASTYRLDTWASYQTFDAAHTNHKPTTGPFRLMASLDSMSTSIPFEPQAGDILTVGDGSPPYGDHITIVVSYDPVRRVFSTISGNGGGIGPDGKRREGVVRADFKLGGPGYCARRLIRLGASDLR